LAGMERHGMERFGEAGMARLGIAW
jgi:hypothetical protein